MLKKNILFSLAALFLTARIFTVNCDPVYAAEKKEFDSDSESSVMEINLDMDNLESYLDDINTTVLDLYGDVVPCLEDLSLLLSDIHGEIVPPDPDEDMSYSIMSLSDDIAEFDLTDDFAIKNNVIIYEGTWAGTSYRAVFPAQYEQYLIVTDEGYLYNLSSSSVTGRLFQNEVDYTEYEYSSLVLNSVLGNVAGTIYNYGYPSYVRTYYEQNGRITNSDSYGLFRVDNIVRTDSSDPARVGNNYLLILMMIGGMQLLCFMKRSFH